MGGSSASPVSIHKRPKWQIALLKGKVSLAVIESHLRYIEHCFKVWERLPQFNASEIEREGDLLMRACHHCEYDEFRLILEDLLINGTIPFVYEIKIKGKTDYAKNLLKELLNRFKKCKEALKKLSHKVRYNEYQNRLKTRYE